MRPEPADGSVASAARRFRDQTRTGGDAPETSTAAAAAADVAGGPRVGTADALHGAHARGDQDR